MLILELKKERISKKQKIKVDDWFDSLNLLLEKVSHIFISHIDRINFIYKTSQMISDKS